PEPVRRRPGGQIVVIDGPLDEVVYQGRVKVPRAPIIVSVKHTTYEWLRQKNMLVTLGQITGNSRQARRIGYDETMHPGIAGSDPRRRGTCPIRRTRRRTGERRHSTYACAGAHAHCARAVS